MPYKDNKKQKAYQVKWEAKNKDRRNKARAKVKTSQRERNITHIKNHYRANPCVDCGYSNILALQFDHVRGIKFKNISELVHGGYAVATIESEIAKCVVRCANCHQIKTQHVHKMKARIKRGEK